MADLTTTKSLLAKLLASENLTVEHGNYPTASMDVKNRVLRLPIWKEMSGSLYDLMVLHEVGHALYTPEDGWHGATCDKGPGFKSFLNVVEDARIERKIKDKYPGGRKAFISGYKTLIEQDFFGIKDVDLNECNLIDRINLHFKGGWIHDIRFSDEELEFVEKVKTTMTWEDVLRVSEELYEYAKEHESETDKSEHEYSVSDPNGEVSAETSVEESEMEETTSDDIPEEKSDFSDFIDKLRDQLEAEEKVEESEMDDISPPDVIGEEDGKSDGESDDSLDDKESNEFSPDGGACASGAGQGGSADRGPTSETDDTFRSREEYLNETGETEIEYVNLPISNLEDIVVDYKLVHSDIRSYYEKEDSNNSNSIQIKMATEDFTEFRNKNKKTVEYLAKEFEMKKAAEAHARTLTANSGIINSEKLYTYKYNEHIFKKINVTPDGKNHGLIMVVDWSGSMGDKIKGTIEQMMTLVMFAKRVGIPFEVFLFSDTHHRDDRSSHLYHAGMTEWTHKIIRRGDILIARHHLLNIFSSRMKANELFSAYINMTAVSSGMDRCYAYRKHDDYSYYSTPRYYGLGGTPLDDSLLVMNDYIPYFKSKNNVQIVNMIYLTDGDSHQSNQAWGDWKIDNKGSRDTFWFAQYSWKNTVNKKTIIRDLVTRREYELGKDSKRRRSPRLTTELVKILRDKHGINIVNFFLVPKVKKRHLMNYVTNEAELNDLHVQWKKNKHLILENEQGWSHLYLILGGRNLETVEQEMELNEGASKAQIKRALSKFVKGRLENRALLSKFIDMVAA